LLMSAPMAAVTLRLRRLAAARLLISHSVFSLPSRLLVALLLTLRPFVRLFKSAQFPLRCGFLRTQGAVTVAVVTWKQENYRT